MDVAYARSWSFGLDVKLSAPDTHGARRTASNAMSARTGETSRKPSIKPAVFPEQPIRVAVVGFGYWGPNLVRNLRELDRGRARRRSAICARTCSSRRPAQPGCAGDDATTTLCSRTSRSTRSSSRRPSRRIEILQRRHCLSGKHAFVEKPLAGSSADGQAADSARRAARPRSHARPHVPVQPAGEQGPGADRSPGASARSTSSRRAASTSGCTSRT